MANAFFCKQAREEIRTCEIEKCVDMESCLCFSLLLFFLVRKLSVCIKCIYKWENHNGFCVKYTIALLLCCDGFPSSTEFSSYV